MTSRFGDRVGQVHDPWAAFTDAVGYGSWVVVAVLLIGAVVALALSARAWRVMVAGGA
ncbi:hypothetical protein [Streptomyces sp. NPDC001530]|uniref:hypothetical protein n=1 Tax=Streptomyces sp. NPDC001530 TaxID=3364582 RepID=UPI0036BD9C08